MSNIPNIAENIQNSQINNSLLQENNNINDNTSNIQNGNTNNIIQNIQNPQKIQNYSFPVMMNPNLLKNYYYPQITINNNINNSLQNNSNNLSNNNIKIPPNNMIQMGIPIMLPQFYIGNNQDQTPVGEQCKIWIGKIPDGISETFMRKLLECCGQLTSWKRSANSTGKLNSFGFCEYATVEGILKCLRLLNNYPLINNELQCKIGSDTEEYLKNWRERKKIEWINSMTLQGISVNLDEIKKKESNGEPLEWELKLISNDKEVLKLINEVVSQRQQIDNITKINDQSDSFLKGLNDIVGNTNLQNDREKERKKKKSEKSKKLERNFIEFEKNWLKHENNKIKELNELKYEKENLSKKKAKLLQKDLEYDSENENKKNINIKNNKKKNDERIKMREAEKKADNEMREKENKMILGGIKNYESDIREKLVKKNISENEIENDLKIDMNLNQLISINNEEKKPQTTLEFQDYFNNSNEKENQEKKENNENNENNEKNSDDDEKTITLNEEEKKGNLNNNSNKASDDEDTIICKENKILNKKNDVENMTLEELISNIPDDVYIDIQKSIIDLIPDKVDDVFNFNINWELVNKYELKRKKFKAWIEKKLLGYFDGVDSFTKMILEKLGVLSPLELEEKIKLVLEDDTKVSKYYQIFLFN